MSQVLVVSKLDGKYNLLNMDGQVIDPKVESTGLPSADAEVLMERIRQGYQYISPGSYVLRMDLAGENFDDTYLEFTEMVTFDLDDDGYPVPKHERFVTQNEYDVPTTDHSVVMTRIAFIDYESMVVKWMDNPMAEMPFVFNPNQAVAGSEYNDDTAALLTIGARHLLRGEPVHVSKIITRSYVR